MSHVLTSETSMILPRFMGFEEAPAGFLVRVRWRGLPLENKILNRSAECTPTCRNFL